MPVDLLVSPPATGKTKACIQKIKKVKFSQPMAKVWVIVPDRQKAAYFRRRLADSGGLVGVRIGTFRDLYREILESNGKFVPVITPALEHRLVQETIDAASTAGELAHYESIKHKPGFITALQDAFAELRGALVRPDRILEYTRGSTPARYELALLYCRFLTKIHDLYWIDQEGQSWLAISTLENNPKAAADIHLVVADGFTSFTGARRQFLNLISQQAGEVLITLPGKLDSPRQVHRRAKIVIENLQKDISLQLTEITTSPRLPAEIYHLEQNILDPGEHRQLETEKPFLIEARSQYEEAREALRWIKGLNQRKGMRLSDCAIFASNLETYQPLLRSAANEFGITVHFSHPDPLAESPTVLALFTLLSLPIENYKTRAILNTLRSPYIDFGLNTKAIEALEKVAMQSTIVLGRDHWTDAWKRLAKSRSALAKEQDEECQRDDRLADIDLLALQSDFDAFWRAFDSVSEARSQRNWVAWLEKLLEQLHFYEKISNVRDKEACISLGEALRAIILSESVLGAREESYTQFVTDLQGAVDGARVDEPRESGDNAVLVGGMIEARGSRFKAVALLGFSEGLFPAVENPDPFLDENLRRDLGMEPRLQREQASIFYQAFTRADSHLLITRPYLSDEGEAWEPSPYWLAAKSLFSEKSLVKFQPGSHRPQAEAASPQELLFWAVQQNHLVYLDDAEIASRWKALDKARDILNTRRSKTAHGPYEGDVEEVASLLASRYPVGHSWSASRLEAYGTCPQDFYIGSILKLEAKALPELGLDAAQLGSIFHRILEKVYQNAIELGDPSLVENLLEDIAASVLRTAPEVYGFRPSPLWEVERAQLVEKLRQTIIALNAASDGWTPIRFEQKFGIQGTPPLEIDLGFEVVHLHGIIDRIDRNSSGQIRVIDYKTGGSNLEKTDLKSGRRLQLPIYARAAQDTLDLGEVVEGFYWKINEGKASSFKLSKFEADELKGPEAAYAIADVHISLILKGIRSGEFPPRPPRGGCPSYCPAAQWCWRYQGGY